MNPVVKAQELLYEHIISMTHTVPSLPGRNQWSSAAFSQLTKKTQWSTKTACTIVMHMGISSLTNSTAKRKHSLYCTFPIKIAANQYHSHMPPSILDAHPQTSDSWKKGIPNLNPFTHALPITISNFACSLTRILHHPAWRPWLLIPYSDGRWLYYQFSVTRI